MSSHHLSAGSKRHRLIETAEETSSSSSSSTQTPARASSLYSSHSGQKHQRLNAVENPTRAPSSSLYSLSSSVGLRNPNQPTKKHRAQPPSCRSGVSKADLLMKEVEASMAGVVISSSSVKESDFSSVLRPTKISFATVMVDVCLSNMLSCFDRDERIQLTTVSKFWRRVIHLPTTWSKDSPLLAVGSTKLLEYPVWLCRCIPRLVVSELSWVHVPELANYPNVTDLCLKSLVYDRSINVEVCSALQRLKIKKLEIDGTPMQVVWDAFFQEVKVTYPSDGSGVRRQVWKKEEKKQQEHHQQPAMSSWSSSIESLSITAFSSSNPTQIERLCSIFASQVWSNLSSIQLNHYIRIEEVEGQHVAAFNRCLNANCLPALTSLQVRMSDRWGRVAVKPRFYELLAAMMKTNLPQLTSFRGDFRIDGQRWCPSPSWYSLQNLEVDSMDASGQLNRFVHLIDLKINREYKGTSLELFQAIGHHNMPNLKSATLPIPTFDPVIELAMTLKDDPLLQVCVIMSRMTSFQRLRLIYDGPMIGTAASWMYAIDALPSLVDLVLDKQSTHKVDPSLVRAIGNVRALKSFTLSGRDNTLLQAFYQIVRLWNKSGEKCLISTLQVRLLPERHLVNEKDEDLLSSAVILLAQLPCLTSLDITRYHPTRVSSPTADSIIHSSYLAELTRLAHLRHLRVHDSIHTIDHRLLAHWNHTPHHFHQLESLALSYVRSSPYRTFTYIDRLPKLVSVRFLYVRDENQQAIEFRQEMTQLVEETNRDRQSKLHLSLFFSVEKAEQVHVQAFYEDEEEEEEAEEEEEEEEDDDDDDDYEEDDEDSYPGSDEDQVEEEYLLPPLISSPTSYPPYPRYPPPPSSASISNLFAAPSASFIGGTISSLTFDVSSNPFASASSSSSMSSSTNLQPEVPSLSNFSFGQSSPPATTVNPFSSTTMMTPPPGGLQFGSSSAPMLSSQPLVGNPFGSPHEIPTPQGGFTFGTATK